MPEEHIQQEHIQPTEKIRTLVVDDSRVIRKAISTILKNEAEIIDAVDGEDGWNKLLQNDDIQVLITDIEMPILDGYQLICRIRAHDDERIKDMPIITVTGAEDDETRTRAFACGATDFITKPIDKVQLKARVRAHARLEETTRQLEETTIALEEEATTDPLTGLTSRRYFGQHGEQDIAYADRHKSDLSLLRIDIDLFRKIYQEHGDDLADEMIKWIASALAKTARTEDTVARIGGSEFAILAPATGRDSAGILGDRLLVAASEKPFKSGDTSVKLTISVGIATLDIAEGTSDSETFDGLLQKANKHLTFAKAEGGNTVTAATRTESMVDQEEVTLGDAPPLGEPQINAKEIISEAAQAFSEKSIADIEKEIAYEVAVKDVDPVVEENIVTVSEIDMNSALSLLANGETEKIRPHLSDLVARILPLLELSDKSLKLGISHYIKRIKESIKKK
ncbi:MAG: diguanylate cyclase [Acidiferrobacterales bacterium]